MHAEAGQPECEQQCGVARFAGHLAAQRDLLAQTIAIGTRARKSVTLCGEMAGEPRYTALLLALGLTGFSMHPSSLLEVRQEIGGCDVAALRRHGSTLLRATSRAGIQKVLEKLRTCVSV